MSESEAKRVKVDGEHAAMETWLAMDKVRSQTTRAQA